MTGLKSFLLLNINRINGTAKKGVNIVRLVMPISPVIMVSEITGQPDPEGAILKYIRLNTGE